MSEDKKDWKIIVENKLNNGKWTKLIMAGIIVLLIITNWTSCEGRRNDKKQYEQNQEAMKKELVVEKNKNGELQTSVVAFKGTVRDLENYSKELAEEVKALKKRRVKVITRTEIVYRDTNIFITNNVIDTIGLDKDEYRLSWDYANEDSTRILQGNSVFKALFSDDKLKVTPRYTNITLDQMRLDFTVGVAKNKKTGFDEIFVTPKNKNVTIGKLEGATLERSKIGINISFYAGYGIYYANQQFGLAPSVGFAITKPLIRF
jgi:hypothetical protein